MEYQFKKKPQWELSLENQQLILHAGADEIYLIEDLNSKQAEKFFHKYKKNELQDLQNSQDPQIVKVFHQLEKAGAIFQSIAQKPSISFSIRWCGKPNSKIETLLKTFTHQEEGLEFKEASADIDLLLIIKQSGNFKDDLMKSYTQITVPHLFIDISLHHTISLGPLVFPSKTACLYCYAGRIIQHWGDLSAPSQAKVQEQSELICSLIKTQLSIFQERGSCPELIEATIAFDTERLTTQKDAIYRLPWCEVCYPKKENFGRGSFELPWKL